MNYSSNIKLAVQDTWQSFSHTLKMYKIRHIVVLDLIQMN